MTRKKNNVGQFTDFSISKKLREKNKSNDYFELMLGNLTLEDIIALKLEICFKSVGIPLYGMPLWKSLPYIVKNAMVKYALSATGSKIGASLMLNVPRKDLRNYLCKEDLWEYFNKEKNNANK